MKPRAVGPFDPVFSVDSRAIGRSKLFTRDCDVRSKAFEALSSEKARKYFDKFVSKWNAGDLDSMYYKYGLMC